MNDKMKESQDSKTHKAAPARPCQQWQDFFDLAGSIAVPDDFLFGSR